MKSGPEEQIAEIVREAVRRATKLAPPTGDADGPLALFHSARAQALKQEIVRTGRKLWQRGYVDGNGGNISARLTNGYVLCTPTLVSKGDLTAEDICVVDLNNGLVCGTRMQTSEILLHLEIYKHVPQAAAVVHCHAPYATAHAIAGLPPVPHLLPEQEVFVGPVPITAYDTPGTAAFAKSILPYVQTHSTILLANHGVVSWSDTVTHAEWAIEVIETYCKTAHLARQLNPSLQAIPEEKLADLLKVKRQLGIPDPRFAEQPAAVAIASQNGGTPTRSAEDTKDAEERLVDSLTQQLLAHLAGRQGRG